MLSKDQAQHVGVGGTATQAGRDIVIVQGLSYSDVRDVALDVFRANFHQLAGPAMQLAKTRAEEITDDFLKRLQSEYPDGLQKAQDPDFQYSLFSVQREYARVGDKDLGDLLVDLLIDRSKQDKRNILQIVLNESLTTAPKLTDSQLAVLALVFLCRYAVSPAIISHEKLSEHFDMYVRPFAKDVAVNAAAYQHLEFTGCGNIQMGAANLEQEFERSYKGLFSKGFSKDDVISRELAIGCDPRFFIQCLNDPAKLQVNGLNDDLLKKRLEAEKVGVDDQQKIMALFSQYQMSLDEIREKCIALRPFMKDVFNAWNSSSMKSFSLTSVGIAIGHANIKRLVGSFSNLSIWIN